MMTTSDLGVAGLRLVRRLATGALCSVYEATDAVGSRRVAFKRMHREHLADPGLVGRCLNEALMLQALHGPSGLIGLPQLFAHGLLPDGCPYLVLELLGDSLAQRLAHHDKLTVPAAGPETAAVLPMPQGVRIGAQVAGTLASLHTQGVIHRDVRPENLLLGGRPERAYVIDLGLAKGPPRWRPKLIPISTGEADFIGTEEYMSPEQWHAPKRVTPATDVYALGVILFRLSSGALPFIAEKRSDLMYQHLFCAPPPLPGSLPKGLATLISGCLEKSPGQRPGAAQVMGRLTELLAT